MVFTVIFFIGILLINFSGGGSSESEDREESAPEHASSPGGSISVKPQKKMDGIPVGYPRTKAGALAAAVNYEMARSTPSYFTDRPFRHSVLTTVMTSESVRSQQRKDDDDASRIVSSLGLK
ncbi:hypothetical protein ACFWZ5_45205, partial [Streptomyces sp. NPDC059003]